MWELSIEDLRKCPIWEFEDHPDEVATVKPAASFEEPGKRGYIAFTKFVIDDGTEYWGYCSPIDEGLDYLQPSIITPEGHARFWYDEPPKEPEPEKLCRLLDREVENIFPVVYECQVAFEGAHLHGRIETIGFSHAT